ncbi:MAG: hypothetical protein JW951_03285, partial [Lentisphaerae bacterium]|nr:hypothetical protein [Lentisphaerota bacterium]
EAHLNSYSYAWWINGRIEKGTRLFPNAPADLFLAEGHAGKDVLLVIPSLELAVCWVDGFPGSPAFRFYLDGRRRVRAALALLLAGLQDEEDDS